MCEFIYTFIVLLIISFLITVFARSNYNTQQCPVVLRSQSDKTLVSETQSDTDNIKNISHGGERLILDQI